MASTAIQRKLQKAISLHQAGEVSQASGLYRQILDLDPQHAEACHLSGLVECSQGNTDKGESLVRKAILLDPNAVHFKANLAAILVGQQKFAEAETFCREVLQVDNRHPKALANLGASLRHQQRRGEAMEIFQRALEIERDAAALCNLATIMSDLGRFEEAMKLLNEAQQLDGSLPEVQKNISIVLHELGRKQEAEQAMRSLKLNHPGFGNLHLTQANLLLDQGSPAEAISEYQAAISADPHSAAAVFGLGCSLLQVGAWDESLEACQLASTMEPKNARFASGYLYAATLNPNLQRTDVVQRHREWGRQLEAATSLMPLQPDLSAGRRLRIGYVSPDIRSHATMSFLFPLLKAHDRTQFEIVIYSQTSRQDDTTESVRSLGHDWCFTRPMSDDQLAQRIQNDRIDILVDVAGHTAENRLPVFARRPAPVQVSFLGYPGTTGLSRIDYFLTDAIREPGDSADSFSEKPVFLPHGAACFEAPRDLDIAPPPFIRNGFITFGSTHRMEKMSAKALELWSRVLDSVPDARLLIFRDNLKRESLRMQLALKLQQAGADLSRIDFAWDLPTTHHAVYSRFDILLDVFPWGSGTVAYDSMWMGVPIPTLAGDRGGCRATASLLHHCGFPELIAQTSDEYISLVQHLAGDQRRLVTLRHELRPAMRQTVCDATRFAHDVEESFRRMWNHFLQTEQTASGQSDVPRD